MADGHWMVIPWPRSCKVICLGLAVALTSACGLSSDSGVLQSDPSSTSTTGGSTTVTADVEVDPPASTSTASTEAIALPELASTGTLTSILDGLTLAITAHPSGGFVGVGDDQNSGFAVIRSDDGEVWKKICDDFSGLPDALAGPYRIWRFGDGYMLYGTSGFEDPTLLGEDPFVATSTDLLAWTEIELPGIDPLFYGRRQAESGSGDVSSDGSIALFLGANRAFESGVGGRVLWAIRPGEAPVLLENEENIYAFTFLHGTPVGLTRTFSREVRLFQLEGEQWAPLPAPAASTGQSPEVRTVGDSLIVFNSGETWASVDLGSTWSKLETLSSDTRSSGYFGEFAIGSPEEPPFGEPETFSLSLDGADWESAALPAGATGIRHLASTETGLVSVVAIGKTQEYEILFTSYESLGLVE